MRKLRASWLVRWIVCLTVASLGTLGTVPAFGMAHRQEAMNQLQERRRAQMLRRAQGLPAGLTQTPDAGLRARIAATERASRKPVADVRPLSAGEMRAALGRGPFRNPYFSGTLPWQKSFRDVNQATGNLFKSFTDVQVAPGQGAGLVLQRTYNSNDARPGPFGVGWTHAYDIRMQEAPDVAAQSGNTSASVDQKINDVPRTDFFGAKHTYHRDADGLYSPPAYLYDEMSSDYGKFLTGGPAQVMDDTDKGMDGTIKHFVNVVTKADGTAGNERACDYIEDRHGNRTVLKYDQTILQADGSTRKLLTQVTDPTGRSLIFVWNNFGTTAQPAYRIVEVDAPTDPATGLPVYKVTYGYYTDPSDPASYLNLHTVTLDPGGLARTTTYAYTGYTGGYYDANGRQYATENGLLASVSDPLGNTVSYRYEGPTVDPTTGGYSAPPTNTVWVDQITEPGGVDAAGGVRTQVWTMSISGNLQTHGEEIYVLGPTAPGPISFRTLSGGPALATTTVACEQGDTTGTLVYLTYDADNNLTQTQAQSSEAHPEFGQALQWTDDYTYGQHGNQLTHHAETRDAAGGVAYFPGTDTTAYFDASKYFAKQAVTDRNLHTTAMDYFSGQDAALGNRGEVAWVRDAGYGVAGSPSQGKQLSYTYNQYGQKATETNLNGVVTQYTYGTSGPDLGNLVQVVQDPGAGHLNRMTTMHYDVMGRVTKSTDPKGQESDFTYNTLGQPLTVKSYSDAGLTLKETISYTYGANGRTDSVADGHGTTTMAYEAGCDRVASVSDSALGAAGTTGYTYGRAGERRSVTLPGGGTWTYDYTLPATAGTNAGRQMVCLPGFDLDKVTLILTGVTDDAGRRVDVQMDPAGGLHAVRFDQAYDGTGALASYAEQELSCDTDAGGWGFSQRRLTAERTTWHWKDTSGQYPQWRARLISENDYTYDSAGQRLTNVVTAMTPGVGGAPQYTGGSPAYSSSSYTDPLGPSYTAVTNLVQTGRTETYGYDATNRLGSVNYGDGQTQTYAFDAMGNRTQRVDSVAGTTAYGYNNANMLLTVGTASYANDLNGNTLTGGGRTNTWDSENRLVQSVLGGHTSAFTYGSDGLRRSSQVDSGTVTRYAYDSTMMVRELKANAQGVLTAAATYLTGPRGMEYRRDDGTGVVKWYVYDGLGSVVGELDPSGNLTCGKKYDVYGAERAGGTGTGTSRQGFCGKLGHVSDAETGLIYMRARYYDPNLGRFISEDPSCHGGNWFAYGSNNPVNKVDSNGKADLGPDDAGWFVFGMMLMGAGIGLITAGVMIARKGVAEFEFDIQMALMTMASISTMFGGCTLGAILGASAAMAAGFVLALDASKSIIGGVLTVVSGAALARDGWIVASAGEEGWDTVKGEVGDRFKKMGEL